MKFTVTTIGPDGKRVTEESEMTPAMEEMWREAQKHRHLWCSCESPTTGRITPRGHSVDVDCGRCGKLLQVG